MSTYAQRYQALTTQRAYTRAVAARGIPALLAPYSAHLPVVPSQRRRVVRSEVTA
mgnify:CR=1 FL=1